MPGNEGKRHEDREQDEGDGDDRRGDRLHRLLRGLAGGELRVLLHGRLDGLHDHDRIVDDDADGEHHRKQGDRVRGVAHGEQHGEGADEAHRDGDERNEGGADAPEEQEHHDDDKDEGLGKGLKTSWIVSLTKTVVS